MVCVIVSCIPMFLIFNTLIEHMIVANRDATKVEEFDEEMNACLLSGSSIATSV